MTRPQLVHERLRVAAAQLAAIIEAGEFSALTPDQRWGLRALTMEMAAWAEEVEVMELPRGHVVRLKPALAVVEGGAA